MLREVRGFVTRGSVLVDDRTALLQFGDEGAHFRRVPFDILGEPRRPFDPLGGIGLVDPPQ